MDSFPSSPTAPVSEFLPAPRRGLKRPAPQSRATRDAHQERKWAKHCGCSGPSCQAELFEDDACEELEFEVFENRLKLHAQLHCARVTSAHSTDLARDRYPRRGSSVSSASTSLSSQSDCESLDPESSPPLLLHFLMMF